ncbi:hypothetical protein AJ80_00471 [Polytolypa hystricis UAMH7299]|uniref:Uncharacterized protein n=1 Tax=Polytolypa hystricis (strain UAMH7299) TaxID=1447883 RepID=A0A2B7Z3I4_POLH7|nr:hypothetical protein AJ80_00471 [Polytolypa hystricis UAMH7299]
MKSVGVISTVFLGIVPALAAPNPQLKPSNGGQSGVASGTGQPTWPHKGPPFSTHVAPRWETITADGILPANIANRGENLSVGVDLPVRLPLVVRDNAVQANENLETITADGILPTSITNRVGRDNAAQANENLSIGINLKPRQTKSPTPSFPTSSVGTPAAPILPRKEDITITIDARAPLPTAPAKRDENISIGIDLKPRDPETTDLGPNSTAPVARARRDENISIGVELKPRDPEKTDIPSLTINQSMGLPKLNRRDEDISIGIELDRPGRTHPVETPAKPTSSVGGVRTFSTSTVRKPTTSSSGSN